jgi:hypothetical protein
MAKRTEKTADTSSAPKKAATKKKTTAKKVVAKKTATKKKVTIKKKAVAKKKTAAKKRVAKKTMATAAIRGISADERRSMIAEAAYLRAESQGFSSDEQHDWLTAEREVDTLLTKAKVVVTS